MTTPYRQLTHGQRYQIKGSLAAGKSQARIAKQRGVHPATISRKPRRNASQTICKGASATNPSDTRRAVAHKHCTPVMWFSDHLLLWLKHGMSPEQIAPLLKQEDPDRAVSHEWIYRIIAGEKRAGGATASAMEVTINAGSCVIECR
jgi:IS30 family transposase